MVAEIEIGGGRVWKFENTSSKVVLLKKVFTAG
jgi:hypothetical protein